MKPEKQMGYVALAVLFPLVVYTGFFFSIVWDLIVVPTFGLRPITLVEASCLIMLADFFRSPATDVIRSWDELINAVLRRLIRPALITLVVFVLTRFS